MILTSREADPDILRAVRDGVLISDDVAQTIASWYHSPAGVDEQITRLSHGLEFNPVELLSRVDSLIKSPEHGATADLMDLHSLKEWVLTRVPHVEITTVEATREEWTVWSEYGIPEDRKGREIFLVSDRADDLGDWRYPGDDGYPADLSGYEPDTEGGVWVPASTVDVVLDFLGGTHTQFWAQESSHAGVDPFQPGGEYTSHYDHPHTDDVEYKTARVVGLGAEDEEKIYRAWKA